MFYKDIFLADNEIFLRLDSTAEAEPARGYLPAYYFSICLLPESEAAGGDGGQAVGHIDLRIGHNENTCYGGNIGYAVDEPYRGHQYAAKACKLLFELARSHDMEYIIITCNPENLASRRTCELTGAKQMGIFDLPEYNESYLLGDRRKCQYRIELG